MFYDRFRMNRSIPPLLSSSQLSPSITPLAVSASRLPYITRIIFHIPLPSLGFWTASFGLYLLFPFPFRLRVILLRQLMVPYVEFLSVQSRLYKYKLDGIIIRSEPHSRAWLSE